MKEETICWGCKNACGGCSWSRNLEPVNGWQAKVVRKGNNFQSYLVKSCPEYQFDGYKQIMQADIIRVIGRKRAIIENNDAIKAEMAKHGYKIKIVESREIGETDKYFIEDYKEGGPL